MGRTITPSRFNRITDFVLTGAAIGVVVFAMCCLLCGNAHAEDSPSGESALIGERPAWCQPGFVCLKTATAASLVERVEFLKEQVRVQSVTKRRALGFAIVCGPSASLSVVDSNTTLAGTLSCTIGAGYRF